MKKTQQILMTVFAGLLALTLIVVVLYETDILSAGRNTLDKNAELLRRDINTKDNPAYDAYRRGKVSSKILLRKQEMQLAKVGSPLALDNVRKALMDMEDDE